MRTQSSLILAILILILENGCGYQNGMFGKHKPPATAKMPFGQDISYPGCIKPNVPQADLDKQVADYYDYWKSEYLKNDLRSLSGGYYIKGHITGGAKDFQPLGSSEGMGYGMIITVLMAGYDLRARQHYDGLYKTFRAFHSSINPNLMGWVIADNKNAQGAFNSATDGDMDIAYSLLLADKQWGSGGSINYRKEALTMIKDGLEKSYITSNYRLSLGDWSKKDSYSTRPSDWMMDHMRAFNEATGDNIWLHVIDTLYDLYFTFSKNYSPGTGLITDFVVGAPPEPCPPNFLNEYPETNTYSYNACRVPLRLAMDYGLYGSQQSYSICKEMISWIKKKTKGNPRAIVDGYKMNGTSDGQSSNTVFVSPFVAASVIGGRNQEFLNKGWAFIKNNREDYYNDTYNLLCMLFISGNWWCP